MNTKAFLALACSLSAPSSLAAVVEATRDGVFDKSPQDILAVLTDFEATCDANCRYSMPGLKETKVLAREGTSSLLWQRIANIQTVTQFVANDTSEKDDGTLVFASRLPTEAEIASLKTSTGLSHETPFRTMSIVWTLQPMASAQTRVSVVMQVQHRLPAILNSTLRQSMEQSLTAMLGNFRK